MDLRLKNVPVFITGACGLLGRQHAFAVAEAGGSPILIDINDSALAQFRKELESRFDVPVTVISCDISNEVDVRTAFERVCSSIKSEIAGFGLVNNAALNPKVEGGGSQFTRIEDLTKESWDSAFNVGLYGSFLCAKYLKFAMEDLGVKLGSIVNISSDHGLISPKQSLYTVSGIPEDKQPVKPITYSLVKHAMIGLTRYLATYWAQEGIRVNTLCPGGVFDGQNEIFLDRIRQEIPMGRMASPTDYKGAVKFLLSSESLYMTGSTLVIDGGRTAW